MSWPDHRLLRWNPTLTVKADDGTALAVEILGAGHPGPAVVFSHGWTLSSRSWYYQRMLAERFRLVLWDHRGHGESEPGPRESRTIDQLGGDLLAVIESTTEDRDVVLAGHSMGGMTIMALAASHPELFGAKVKAVCLVDTSAAREPLTMGLPPRLSAFANRQLAAQMQRMADDPARVTGRVRPGSRMSMAATRFLNFGRGADRRLVSFVDAMTTATPVEVIGDFFRTLDAHDKRTALEALSEVATLVVVGERDRLTPPAQARAIAAAVPGSRLVTLAGAGHCSMIERPNDVNAALYDLIAGVEQAAS